MPSNGASTTSRANSPQDDAEKILDVAPSGAARPLHVAILLLVGTLWGVQPALIKILTSDLPEIATLGLLLAAMAALVGAYLAITGRMLHPTRSLIGFLTVAGAAEYAVPLLVAFVVAAHIDAGLLTLIMSSTPVFTVALAAATGTDRIGRSSVIACLIGLAAILLLVVPQDALPSRDMVPWCLAALAIPISYSCGSIYVSHAWPKGLDALQVAFGGSLFASLMLSPFWIGPLLDGQMVPRTNTAVLAFAALIAVTIAEMVLYFYLLKNAGAVFTSFSSFVMIASGFIAGAALFGERPSLWVWASVALFSVALFLILRSGPSKDPH